MGLATSSTSLAVMTLSEPAVQGRNGSSLNLSDALGAGLFVGVSGTIFAALHDVTELSVTFGAVLGIDDGGRRAWRRWPRCGSVRAQRVQRSSRIVTNIEMANSARAATPSRT